ncbi:hypothetical protein BKA56DRAFT_103903 [Ilyonectria sp. MPI-CAGE-AT-0026]|nr:hypothetical protein BKA56DRAFT_103903 [Ilyonectria sp. MPI-CAGE-AT-0026]
MAVAPLTGCRDVLGRLGTTCPPRWHDVIEAFKSSRSYKIIHSRLRVDMKSLRASWRNAPQGLVDVIPSSAEASQGHFSCHARTFLLTDQTNRTQYLRQSHQCRTSVSQSHAKTQCSSNQELWLPRTNYLLGESFCRGTPRVYIAGNGWSAVNWDSTAPSHTRPSTDLPDIGDKVTLLDGGQSAVANPLSSVRRSGMEVRVVGVTYK